MEEIISKLPYNSYSDLFSAIYNRKAIVKFTRSVCFQISNIRHPYFTNLSLYLGCFINVVLIVSSSVLLDNYWLLLWIPINFILSTLIEYTPHLKYLAWTLLFIDIFIIRTANWLLVSSINVIIMLLCYKFWWNKICKYAIKELKYNEDAFVWAWNNNGICIEDIYGNSYYNLKLKMEEEEN